MDFDISNIKNLQKIAEQLSTLICKEKKFFIFYLEGNLGSGKTTLVREIMSKMGWKKPVKSPTFSILEEYEFNGMKVLHADLYRLEQAKEFEFIGLEINFDDHGVFFIEWPEKIDRFNSSNEIFVKLTVTAKNRILNIDSKPKQILSHIDRIKI